MGMKADGVLYLAAEFIDTFNEINKQVEKGAIKVAKNNQIKLSVDEKSLLTSIDKSLGSKSLKGFDLSGVIIPYLKKFSEEAPDNELGRKIILKKLQDDIGLVDIVKSKAVKNNNLKAMSADDIASAVEEVNSLIYKDKLKSVNESPVKAITEIFLKHASNVKAEIQKQLLEEFGENVSKYGVSEKEANDKLSSIYDSLAKRAEKEFELGGRKNKVRLEDVATEKDLEKIQGYYSRLESLGSPISGKSKELGDMLTNLSDDVDSFREGLDDELFDLWENVYSYTEREKKLFEDVRKKSLISSRDKVKPTYFKNKEDTIEPIIETTSFTESTKKKDTTQDNKNKAQENNKALEQAKEITEAESKTADLKKEQTQEIKKQNELLQEQKDKEKSLKNENISKKTSDSSKIRNKDFANDIADIFNLMQQEGSITSTSSQEQVNEIEEEKEQVEQIIEEKEKTIEKTKEQAQTEQQVTDELKEQKNAQQSLQEDSQDNKKKSELKTLEDIKEETKQITEQEQKATKAKEESLKVTQEELKAEQEINNKKEKPITPIDSNHLDSTQSLLNEEAVKTTVAQETKEKKEQEETQKKIVESKNKELEVTEKIAEAEKQITTENQKQEEAEEKKPIVMLVNKGRKLADVKTKGKSNSQIQAQLEAKKREKAKSNKRTSANDTEQVIDETAEAAAKAAAEADMKAAEAQKAKEDAEILAKLREKFGIAEKKANEESIQQIEVSSEQMQKLKKGIQEATESLKEYKEINDKIAQAQADKDNYAISQQTIDEMVQANALSSSIDMAEYIRSAYRMYKKSGNEDDEKVLKEALRQYKLPTKKKKYLHYLTDENGERIKDENGEYKTEIKIADAYRDDEYLYSKNGKKLKSYEKDERYKAYIQQADDERRAYEKAQRKLPSLLEERQAGQKDFSEVSARIQQMLLETGLDAEKVNEILSAINGNLTDEEAIWKVINSYIKEASVELGKQQNISEDTSTLPDSSTASASTSSSASTSKSKPSSIPFVPQIPNVSNANINQSEIDSGNEASNEARGFNLISVSAEGAAEAKRKFVEANKEVLQSIVGSMPKIEQEAESLQKINDTSISSNTNQNITEGINDQSLETEEAYLEAATKVENSRNIYEETIEGVIEDNKAKSQSPIQYNFEPDYEDIEKQAQEARQYYEDQISNDFEIKVETKLDLKEDETGQLSLFDNILPEENWGQEIETQTNNISETAIKGQISFQQLQEAIENSERAFAKLTSSKNTNGKSFIQNTDLPAAFLKSYEGILKGNDKGYKTTANLRELKNLGDELADVKTKLKVSFDEAGNLKSSADPLEVQSLLNKYDELVNKIQNLKAIIQSPSSQESFLLEEFKQITKAEKEASDEAENFKNKTQEALNKTLTDKNFASGKDTDITTLDSYFKVGSSDNLDKVRSTVEELKILKEQLKASRADDGSLIGEPKDVSVLIERYNTLSKTLQSLITQIKLPDSSETIGLKIAEDAKKAEKELDELKAKVDTVIGKSSLFEAQTLKTINAYGAFNGEEGKKTDLIAPDKLGEKYGDRFAKQQEQVQQLISKFREYKTAVEELETLRTSDNTTLEQLTEANDKVKNLKDNITTLSQTIKTSGIANASEEQLGALKNKLEIFLEKNPNLTLGIRQQIQEYINILNSGASVSKTRYASMTADLNKFVAAQTSGTTIWEQMVGKMREGIAFLATKFSFYQVFNQFRQGFEVIHQFDDALTEMMKVSDETRLSLERYQKTTFDTADAIGTNALQIQNSTADFMRLGETLNEAAESAKSANVLMNVSEFQSIDEATKSLIAMSAAYDDLSKMNIIDKLNEVGNNFSISTSEAAEALQSSASALQTAGNSMDESLALITAGNAVVQDANKVGTGMRTIALRLTGTKTAKEQLEEMGEETENVITTQSKLRDTIKEATAVASNGFKGFDILDDNGNYKSTYEIMLGIADVYDEIVETDKQLGRNNANLLLESVAGKNRANIAASIFQNPQLLKDAYKSSQEANGSAMRENEKYVQSISGHIAQLKNAWQEMWANAANRDVINFFIDAAKAVVNLANAIGVLPTTFALMLPYLNIITKVRSKDNKGIVTQFLDWANGLNEAQKAAKEMATAQEGLNAVKEAGVAITTAETVATEAEAVADAEGAAASATKTIADEAQTASSLELAGAEVIETTAQQGSTAADIEGAAASAGKTAANLAEAGSNAAAGASGFGQLGAAIGGKLSAGIGRLTGAFSGLVGTIGAVPVGLGLVAGALLIGKKAYDAHREAVFNDAKATAENIKTQQEATSQQIETYKQLKTQLDSGDLSEQETLDTKQKILDIQKTIADQYGVSISTLDMVNGKLEEQLGIIQNISQTNAENQYNQNSEGFKVAEQEYNKNRKYKIKMKYPTDDIREILGNSGFDLKEWNNNGSVVASINDDVDTSINKLTQLKQSLIEARDTYSGYRSKERKEAINEYIEEIDKQLSKAEEVRTQYENTYLQKLTNEMFKNGNYDIYSNYQSSVSNLEDAYITGDTKKINEARKAFDEASIAKDKFLSISGNEQFALLFSKIDTSLIDAKNRFQDTVDLLKDIPEPKEQDSLFEGDNKKVLKENAKAQNKLTKEQKKAYKAAKELYSLNPDKVDIKATLDNNAYASGRYADALNDLMGAMGWTSADADNLISALVAAGIVQGDAADIANIASGSYDAFSSSVETAIGALGTLNTALSESAKGTGITEQTLTELKSAFGDNLNSVLETTANGYHLNVEGAYLLRQQQEALTNADYASAVYEQYQALEKLQEGYLKAKEAGEDTSGYVQQRQAIQANIDKLNEDLMAFNNANSAYQTWLSKQSSEGEREMYNSIYSGYDAVKDELDRGWAGEKTRSWLDLIFNDEGDDSFNAWTSSAEKVKEKFEEVTKDIEGTGGYSIADFFTVDANGKSTSQGVWNFFKAIENKQDEVGEKFVDLEEGWFDFGKNGAYQIADLLGMDVESVQGILRAAADAGFEIHMEQPLYSLEQLKEKAYSAKDALEETMGTKLKINLDPQSEEEVDDAMQKVMQYQQTLTEDTSIDPNVKTERLQQLADLMNFLAAKKREFVEGNLFNFEIDSKELQESKKNINEIVNKLSSYSKEAGKTEFSEQFAIDPMLLNNVDYLQEKIDTLKEIRPNVDDTQVEYLDQLLMQLQNRVNLLNETNISGGTLTIDQFMAAEQVVNDINAKLDYANQHKDIEFNWDADEEFTENLNTLANLPEDVKIDLGIPVDKNGEELLELAKKGELHIGIKTEGEVPKTGEQKGTTVTNTVNNEQHNFVKTVLSAEDNASSSINLVDQGLTQLSNKKTIVPINGDTKDFDKKAAGVANTKKEAAKDVVTNFKGNNNDVINKANTAYSVASALDTTITTVFKSSGLGGLRDDIQDTINKVNNLNSRISTVSNRRISGTVQANGTAHVNGTVFARGTAFAGGKWGVSRNQQALVGELGTELLVRDGQWQTIGDNGAEFVNLKKGDIVFNHKQAQELLENGYVTSNKGRGHLVGFANGTAYDKGTLKGLTPTVSSKSMGGTTTPSTKGTKGTSGTTHGSDNNNNNNNNNNTDKKAKETKNTLDEVEILIARIERQISNLDKTIGKTYLSWTSRNKAIKTNLAKVSKEIKDQNQAYTTYMKKANSIQITTGSKKTDEQKKKESESWKAKIKNGKFKIEDVKDSDLWDKINEYKQWYEKALAAKDAIADLTSKEAELYKQRFDNEQTYFENLIGQIEHSSTIASTLADTLEENGQLASKVFVFKQRDEEQARLKRLQQEYNNLIKRRDEAVKAGKIKKGSEMWYEMQESINGVCESIKEAEKNIVSYNNTLRQIDWDRWDKIHDAIDGVNNELEFLYDLLDEDKMFDEEGTITNQGITAFALLAQQYDTYFKEVQKYRSEIEATQKQLDKDPYNQDLVDKLKDLKEAQQDAASNAKKMKDSMVDVTEKGIKKQIDYVKKLIDDYEDLLETQKDQTEYAKKVADQQKEINKLEKQYRAIQNDNSEEGATKRQRLRDQIEEKRQSLQETQEDRRLSETKDMLSKFEENFEDFLNNKLNNVEKIVQDVITATNNNRDTIKNTINEVSKAYGYTPSSTLQSAIDDMSKKLVSYFNSQGKFTNADVSTITQGVNAIVKYFTGAQSQSETTATQQVAEENIAHNGGTGTAVTNAKGEKTIVDKNGKIKNGFYTQNGKTYYAKKGEQLKGQWLTLNNKKYYLDSTGARVTGNKYINGRYYQFDKNGVLQKKSDSKVRAEVIKSSKTHMMAHQDAKGNTVQGYYDDKGVLDTDHTGWAKKGGKIYRFENGKQVTSKWVTSNGKRYYVRKDGTRASGFVTINGKTYYFADSSWKGYKSALDGQMLTGFKTIGKYKYYFGKNGAMLKNAWQAIDKKRYYFNASGHAVTGKQTIKKVKYTFNDDGSLKKKGWKKGTASVPTTDWAWTNEGKKPEAIIRKSDGAILTPLSKGDSVIPNNAMKNMYQALTDPAKYLKQYTMPDVKVVQSTGNSNSSPIVNMQFIANGVQDANKFANELMNNKKLEKWIQEVTLGQANGNNSFRKYNYAIR